MKKAVCFLCVLGLATLVSAQTLTWTNTSALPIPIRDNCVVAYNGYVYSLGGRTTDEADPAPNPHAIADVYVAAINPDGSLGTWTATTFLPQNLAVGGAYAYNGRMYYWGGWIEDYSTVNTCYYATINANGTLGAWTTSGVTIPDGGGQPQMDSFGRGVLGFGKYLYIVGGENNLAVLTDQVYVSEIQASGDFGAWQTTTALPAGDWFHGVAMKAGTSANFIYLIGGNQGGTSETHIYRNTINADGTLGASWDTIADLFTGTYEQAIAVSDKAIYSIGGLYGSTSQNTVVKIVFNPDNGLLLPLYSTALPEARARVAAVGYKVNDTEYLAVAGGGGYASTNTIFDTCVYTEIPVILASRSWELYD